MHKHHTLEKKLIRTFDIYCLEKIIIIIDLFINYIVKNIEK